MPVVDRDTQEEVLQFWFGNADDDAAVAEAQSPLWWGRNEETDRAMAGRFEPLVRQALGGALDEWTHEPRGRLALILLTDQFTRNIYRDTPEAFSGDEIALRLCRDGLGAGHDRQLRRIKRVFFYLPLEHSENLANQVRCVQLYKQLRDDAPPRHQPLFAEYIDFARRHHDIIARFGRFPHRNAILGRQSTAEEAAFLKQPGSSF